MSTTTAYSVCIPNRATGTVAYGLQVRTPLWFSDIPAGGGTMRGIDCVPNFAVGTNSATGQIGLYVSGNYGSNTNTTISNTYGLYVDAGSNLNATVSNSYGLYVNQPTFGTGACGYFNGVVSIGGTGPQPTNTSSLTIGPYNDTSIAINVYGSFTGVNTGNTNMNGIRIVPTFAPLYSATVGNIFGLNCAPTFRPSTGSPNFFNAQFQPTFIAPAGSTIASAYGIYVNPVLSSNVGTITNTYGMLISSGGSASGTITNGYGLYVTQPSYSTNKYTAYFDPIIGIGSTPNANRVINIGGSITSASSNFSIVLNSTHLGSTGASTVRGFDCEPVLGATLGATVATAMGLYSYNTFGNNAGTITNAYGMYIDTGSAGGTITTGYGMYVNTPAYGTTKIATYSDNLNVGYAGTAPPATGAIFRGQVVMGGTSTDAPSTSQLTLGDKTSGTYGRLELNQGGGGASSRAYFNTYIDRNNNGVTQINTGGGGAKIHLNGTSAPSGFLVCILNGAATGAIADNGLSGGMYLQNATQTPSGNPANGGYLYVSGGALVYRGSGGSVTSIAPA